VVRVLALTPEESDLSDLTELETLQKIPMAARAASIHGKDFRS